MQQILQTGWYIRSVESMKKEMSSCSLQFPYKYVPIFDTC